MCNCPCHQPGSVLWLLNLFEIQLKPPEPAGWRGCGGGLAPKVLALHSCLETGSFQCWDGQSIAVSKRHGYHPPAILAISNSWVCQRQLKISFPLRFNQSAYHKTMAMALQPTDTPRDTNSMTTMCSLASPDAPR